jgi:hypothetical protein
MDTVPMNWKISDTSLGSLAQPKGVLSQVQNEGTLVFGIVG